jgi:hypothetical protein
MKAGVCTVPWAVVNVPRRARELLSRAVTQKGNFMGRSVREPNRGWIDAKSSRPELRSMRRFAHP